MEDWKRFIVGFIIGFIIRQIVLYFEKKKYKRGFNETLNQIESFPPMFGSVTEVEAMYIMLMIQASSLLLTKKEITWSIWQSFLIKEKGFNKVTSSLPYNFKNHNELIESLGKFKKEVF